MKVSVIVPCYNVISKIQPCIESLKRQSLNQADFEVIFVDDFSTDNSFEYLKEICLSEKNWSVYRLDSNSGSPSKPRNLGVRKSQSDYIFYLDADDELFPDTLEEYLKAADENKYDVIRGYLIVNDGKSKKEFNKIVGFDESLTKNDTIQKIIKSQSTTVCQLIKKDLLINNAVEWPENIRMGEDTIFLLSVFKYASKIGYIEHPTFIYNKKENKVKSSTQQYGSRELKNHLYVWKKAEDLMQSFGLSYYSLRLKIGIKSAIESILKFYSHDFSKEVFTELSIFINQVYEKIDVGSFNEQFVSLINLIKENNFNEFIQAIKPKLLIAGFDLKFINPAIPYLSKFYSIKVDEWKGHEIHNEATSTELLNWADIIWCEWLLGNAVWYAKNKQPNQKLVVRLHRFELTTKYIKEVDVSKIDKIITVSYYFFEKTIERMNLCRSKVALIPNYLITDKYLASNSEEKYFNLGMIGILPSRKGYYEALELLNNLVQKNQKYKLHLYGKFPEDLSWIAKDPKEMSYYQKCDDFIKDNDLSNNLIKHGWCDISQEIKNIGYVLSLSKDEEIPESFHIAPAEAFCANNIGVFLNWRGVEYIYPNEFIFNDIENVAKYIIKNSGNRDQFSNESKRGRKFIVENYSIDVFCKKILKLI